MTKPKSLRLFLLLFAGILSSQLLGTALRGHQLWLYFFAALLFLSGLTILSQKCDRLTIILNLIIAALVLVVFIMVPQPWPLYLIYWFYNFLCLLFCSLKLKLKI